mmetsp:Transcript_14086/g.35676  ORF Transcript_14086/g.35676 Transcript_14086/m.35676 type:complete len:320 (+) Transcript_14086:177-1136(+)
MAPMRSTAVVKPIVFGSIAFFLGKKAINDENTHKWSIYVRGLEDEDLSYYVKRVVFTLHPSCQIPVVTCDEPPYVVTQLGWGEFDVKITIIFRDAQETSVDIIHFLRLYPPGSSAANTSSLVKKPVVNEHYEEVVFHEPSEAFYKVLTSAPRVVQPLASAEVDPDAPPGASDAAADGAGASGGEESGVATSLQDTATPPAGEVGAGSGTAGAEWTRVGVSPAELAPHFTKISEVDSMKKLLAAQAFVSREIEKACQELVTVQDSIAAIKSVKQEAVAADTASGINPAGTAADGAAGGGAAAALGSAAAAAAPASSGARS